MGMLEVIVLQHYYFQHAHSCLPLTHGYDGTHSGYGFGDRNADGSRILEFADGLNLVMCNTLFMKQESKLVTYVTGSAKSTVDYIMVRQRDKVKVRNYITLHYITLH